MKKTITIIALSFLLILIAGCAKPPNVEVETAKQAVGKAKKAEASRYAPKEFKACEETLSEALKEIEIQNKKILGKDYKKAVSLLEKVVTLADDAVKATEELKTRTEEEATKAEAETAVNRVYAAYKKAKKSGKKKSPLAQVMDLLKQAQSAMKEGDFQKAVEMAEQADAKLKAL